jgi:hypothetical protein
MKNRWKILILIVGIFSLNLSLPVKSGFDEKWFLFSIELHGPNGYTRPQVSQIVTQKLANSFTLHQPMSGDMEKLLVNNNLSLILQVFGSASAGTKAGEFRQQSGSSPTLKSPAEYVKDLKIQQNELKQFALVTAKSGTKVIWNPMPEWDQSGGNWVRSRPHYREKTREQAYKAFTDFYMGDTHIPLGNYLKMSPSQRGVILAAGQTDFPCNTAWAYENGADMVMVERSIDELSDISTGIAFVRGLSRQYDKRWGIDLSTWRTSNNGATSYNPQGKLIGGWSENYCMRHFYISYLCGANIMQIEAATYYYDNGKLNPFGLVCKEFADFSLVRHKDVGRPLVNTALMLDFYNGFDAKHWLHCQNDAVWYREIPYSNGDFMLNNFMKVAYPEHWLHGLTPGAPFNTQKGPDSKQFRKYLSDGGDPLPYEPMGKTRYGDNLDIIYNNASDETLAKYKIISLIGGVSIDNTMRPKLRKWVKHGGILVVNAKQVTSEDESLLGVKLTNNTGSGTSSKWVSDGVPEVEHLFTYTKVMPITATVIANNNGSDALITSNKVGKGEVILTTPWYLQSLAKDTLLNVGVKLFDKLDARYAVAKITGTPVEYIVNQGAGKTIVTIVNNSGNEWNGTIELNKPDGKYTTTEWRSDEPVSNTESNGKVKMVASVPPYEIKIYALVF